MTTTRFMWGFSASDPARAAPEGDSSKLTVSSTTPFVGSHQAFVGSRWAAGLPSVNPSMLAKYRQAFTPSKAEDQALGRIHRLVGRRQRTAS
jgi:hypothetical protein